MHELETVWKITKELYATSHKSKNKGEKIMRVRKIATAILIMMLVFVAGCGKAEDLTGKWVCTDEGVEESLDLFSDGTGTFMQDGESCAITWVAENGRFKLTRSFGFLGESSGTFDYELKKDMLTFLSENGQTQNFTRE